MRINKCYFSLIWRRIPTVQLEELPLSTPWLADTTDSEIGVCCVCDHHMKGPVSEVELVVCKKNETDQRLKIRPPPKTQTVVVS